MNRDEFAGLDLLAQADLLKRGEVSSPELVEAAIKRVEAVNPVVNAVITKLYDSARAEAQAQKDTYLGGVPFLIKDLYCHMAGVPTTGASRLTEKFVPDHDSELMVRYRKAGLATLGKTNLCEFGTLGTTEPKLFGATLNPWNTKHSSGGSSGGAGAAVASGMIAAAHGGDGAGSIRIPASCCGVFGLKPTRGRITLGPDLGDSTGSIVNEHVLSMTVRDSAALLDLTQGPMLGDPYAAPPPPETYRSQIARPPQALRIALTTRSLLGTEVHPDCVEAVVKTAKLCEDLGHIVTIDAPEIDGELYCRTYVRFWAMTATRAIASIALRREARAEELAPQTEAFNQYLFSIGSTVSAAEYLLNLGWFHGVGRSIARFLGKYDVWLTPTLGTPPPVLGHFDAEIHGGETVMSRFLEFLSFTTFANMAGLPAMNVPLFWNSDNLPVGSQFTAGVNQEGLLFRLAAQLEQAQPWRHRTPPVTAARATSNRGTLS